MMMIISENIVVKVAVCRGIFLIHSLLKLCGSVLRVDTLLRVIRSIAAFLFSHKFKLVTLSEAIEHIIYAVGLRAVVMVVAVTV